MKVIQINDFKGQYISEPICACLGNFDGIHLAHQKLIEEVNKSANAHAMITFNPHPIKYFIDPNYKELTPLEAKIDILKDKLDYLIVLNFNHDLANMSPDEFIEFLKRNMVCEVVCGDDYHFGYQAKGDSQMLKEHFKTTIIPSIHKDNEIVKSHIIRFKLQNGEIKSANSLLGRAYTIKGIVQHGSHLGRTIGFPTANLYDLDYLLPKNGVYITLTKVNNRVYKSMTNIGYNPTFNKKVNITVETNILDFNENIYGKEIYISFIDLIREERKFEGISELHDELKRNKDYVRSYNISTN